MFIPELRQLQDILSSFLGSPKNDVTDGGQLQYNCPRCIEEKGHNEVGKYNLEINILKGVFKCWSCCSTDDSMKGPIRKLIRKYGNAEILKQYEAVLSDIRNNKLYRLPEYSEVSDLINEKFLTLPSTFTKIPDIKKAPKRVREYLEKRHITQDIIDKFNIGFTKWEEREISWSNRIIVPSYNEFGNLNYYVGRDFTGNDKIGKYKNCDTPKSEVVYLESHLCWDADVYIAEGALDAIYCPNCTAFLGKILSETDELYQTIMERANANVVFVLDSDTNEIESMKLFKLFDKGRLKGKIRYIKMDKYKDFGEAYEYGGNSAIIEILKHQSVFSDMEIILGVYG